MPDCRSDELHVKKQTTILSFYLPLHLEVLLDDYQHNKTLVIKHLYKYLLTIYHYLNSTYTLLKLYLNSTNHLHYSSLIWIVSFTSYDRSKLTSQ